MTLPKDTVFEVDAGGDDEFGGGFVNGGSGTDYSQQITAQATLTTASVVNSGDTTKIDVDTGDYTVTTADIDNLMQINGGDATADVYRITAVDTGASPPTWTLDKSAGTAGQTVVAKMGGAYATIAKATGLMSVVGMASYVKDSATYSISTGIVTGTANNNSARTRLIGYGSTRGDNGQPTILTTAAVVGISSNGSGQGWSVENFIIDCNDVGTIGIVFTNNRSGLSNIKVLDATGAGFDVTTSYVLDCEASGCAGFGFDTGNGITWYYNCWSHDNAATGFKAQNSANGTKFVNCRSTNNVGASSHGFDITFSATGVHGCVAYGNGGDGIRVSSVGFTSIVTNNILYGNGGYGLNNTTTTDSIEGQFTSGYDHNAFGSNTSGAYNNITAGNNDVTLTADPFTAKASDDYTLNSMAGGGALCRNAGLNNFDIGYFQHTDAGGGGGGLITQPGMVGGMNG